MNAPAHLETVTVGGMTYVVVASAISSSLTVLRLDYNGNLTHADHVVDELGTRFNRVSALETVMVDGRAFIIAGGGDDGISVFTIQPDGHLLHLATLQDTNDRAMQDVSAISAIEMDGRIVVFVSSRTERGISQFLFDPGDLGQTCLTQTGQHVGTSGSDLLQASENTSSIIGGAGDDILIAGSGPIQLTGGAGSDLFVASAIDGRIRITDFDPLSDRLDLSNLGMIRSIAQLTFRSQGYGILISFGTTEIEIRTSTGTTLSSRAFDNSMFALAHYEVSGMRTILTGTTGNDALAAGRFGSNMFGYSGQDTLTGHIGRDVIRAGAGYDVANGAAGNDQILGEDGNDLLRGGAGNDELQGGNHNDTLFGGPDHDRILGQAGDDISYGEDGNDAIIDAYGNNTILGGNGNDRLTAGLGRDRMDGGSGNDSIFGGFGNDTLTGADGNDLIRGEAGDDWLAGGTGNDWLEAGTGSDTLRGVTGNDTLIGSDGHDVLYGDQGNDLLLGGTGDDRMFGGADNDRIAGQGGNDVLWGGYGNDTLIGGDGNDVVQAGIGHNLIYGDNGNDRIRADQGNDTIFGGLGNDLINGIAGSDQIDGGAGNDTIYGGNSNGTGARNALNGGAGNDLIFGGRNADRIRGGAGQDQLSGGSGHDLFVFATPADFDRSTDRVTDFVRGMDDIDLRGLGLSFIGRAEYSGTGQVRISTSAALGLVVEIDLDGNRQTDLRIALGDIPDLIRSDFLL
ncbi:calcium-binding protein [Paracoccus aestuariivivens]|uniref:Calcium-binding protein n=2 Tax=Paracoccus aestuariivivens TaxID=1820333 RepID=A0A6L6J6Z3_9RHOB|nr:calcium-binding protein [Paracoccus aestuariivivens]